MRTDPKTNDGMGSPQTATDAWPLGTIVAFLEEIGLPVHFRDTDEPGFLPGIAVEAGSLFVDERRLLYPGDLLHEAGHLAVLPPGERADPTEHFAKQAGLELAAIAWSWAALTHLKLDPEVVFHEAGYRGGSRSIIENFSHGHTFGVPLLQWFGMTCEAKPAGERGLTPFPHMLCWLREA